MTTQLTLGVYHEELSLFEPKFDIVNSDILTDEQLKFMIENGLTLKVITISAEEEKDSWTFETYGYNMLIDEEYYYYSELATGKTQYYKQ